MRSAHTVWQIQLSVFTFTDSFSKNNFPAHLAKLTWKYGPITHIYIGFLYS